MSPQEEAAGLASGASARPVGSNPDSPTAEVHRAINRFLATADERSRRLLAGSLALQHGRGGIALVARITGLSPHTIRRGRRELAHGHLDSPGTDPTAREPGASRLKKKSRGRDGPGGAVGRRHRRRPDHGVEVDPPLAPPA